MNPKEKYTIAMFSSAGAVAGQGVGSAYEEQVNLIKTGASDLFEVSVNKWASDPDIQHFHTVDPGFMLLMKRKSSVNVAYCHFLPDTLMESLRFPKVLQPIVNKYIIDFYNLADELVVVNPSFIDELVKYGIDRDKITYIPNFVSKETFHPLGTEVRNEWRDRYNIDHDAFVVLGCGQVQTRKGVQDFVKTAQMLPQVHFVWAGGFSFGPMTEGYEELKTIMENPPQNVTFTGIVDREDMVNIYNMGDVLFVPSFNELFPMTILEAINFNLPLVCRNLDLYKDILFDDYQTGENNEDFARTIQNLMEDAKNYEYWSQKSEHLSNFYSREHVLDMWKKFYVGAWEKKFKDVKEIDNAVE